MITSKQRAYLRGLANELPAIMQIGKGGISEEMCKQISNALDARELIKLRVLDNAEYLPREAAEEIAEAVIYFASDASAYTTGQTMTVSGGFGLATPVYGELANASSRR